MTQDRATPHDSGDTGASRQKVMATSYYGLMGLHPSASVREIRQAYRDLSKLYHPDTTSLSATIATAKFQQLNEAYATLSSPERRTAYDRKIGYSSVPVIQPQRTVASTNASSRAVPSSSAYLDATDRPLSPGEVFALFILGLTFVGCLILAIAIGITRGEAILQPSLAHTSEPQQEIISVETDLTNQSADVPMEQSSPSPAKQSVHPPAEQSSPPSADPVALPPSSLPPV